MITIISVESFKSLEKVEIELGNLNVFVGANGSGKSNLLEAIGVLSAAADGKVTDQTLLQRGVRPGVPALYPNVPSLYISAFPSSKNHDIHLCGSSTEAHYGVSLNYIDPSPAWRFRTELLTRGNENIIKRETNRQDRPNTENGLAALKAVELNEDDSALSLIRRLQDYVIYTPATSVLRGLAPETQPRQPLGLSGGRLPDAVQELMKGWRGSELGKKISRDVFVLIDWASSFGSGQRSGPVTEHTKNLSASSLPTTIYFTDKYMMQGRNDISAYNASEGALYVLFLAVLAAHPKAPAFCAIDNADHGLNPGLATKLMKHFADWVLSNEDQRQILMTSHNPAVLDGLPLQDDRVRLFTVDRDNKGKTIVHRVVLDKKILAMADKGWTLSRLWMNKLIGGMPNV